MSSEVFSKPEPSPAAQVQQAQIVADLINNGSIELCDSGYAIPSLPAILPHKKSVFVPVTRKRPLLELIDTLQSLKSAGFDPVPHIAARRISSSAEIELFLKNAVQLCGVHRVLLVGGDVNNPAGPYNSARDLLAAGILQSAGVREIAFAGYPDVHPFISQNELDRELQAKITLAQEMKIGASIITQFSFDPRRIVDYCAKLSKMTPLAPVYIGIPGPCDPIKLLKYARICGVNASAKMLGDMGFKAVKLAIHSDPDEQLQIVARGVSARRLDNVVGVHIFSFGNIYHSAKWMKTLTGGNAAA